MTNQSKEILKHHCMIVHAYYPLGEPRVEREALALVDRGYSVDVLCLRRADEPAIEVVNGVNVYRLPVKRREQRRFRAQIVEYLTFFMLVFFKLAGLYPRRRYGTVQAHNLPDFLIFAALIPKLAGARLILDLHDLMPEFMAARTNKPMNSLPVRATIIQEQLACRFADQVITVTELWKDRLIQRGVHPGKVGVVMNLADERIFRAGAEFQQPARKDPRFTLVYHGGFKQRYGMDVLIRSIAIAHQNVPELRLILQGVGDYAPEMFSMVDQLGLQENVQINNFTIPTQDLPALIYQADMGVVPNYDDIFTGDLLPTKLLEYAALNLPVIAARTRSISAYFNERMVRFFIPGDEESLANTIVEVYHRRDELPEQSRQMARFNHRYQWAGMARHYAEMIERLSPGFKTRAAVEQTG